MRKTQQLTFIQPVSDSMVDFPRLAILGEGHSVVRVHVMHVIHVVVSDVGQRPSCAPDDHVQGIPAQFDDGSRCARNVAYKNFFNGKYIATP